MNSRPPPPPPPSFNTPANALAALTAQPFATTMSASAVPTVVAPPVIENLTDLTDDESMESWAASGTKLIDKPKAPSTPPPPAIVGSLNSTLPSTPPPPMCLPPVHMQQSHSYPPVAMAPMSVPSHAKMKTNWLLWGAAASFVALFSAVAVGGGAAYYFYRAAQQQAALEEESNTRLAAALQTSDTNNDVNNDAKNDVNNDAKNDTDDSVKTAPAVHKDAWTVHAAPAPTTLTTPRVTTTTTTARPSTTNTAPAKPTVQKGEGTLQTFAVAKGQPIFVDGAQIGVGGTRVKTTCGNHQVSVGSGKPKIVSVPCDGAITVGSPDGS